MLLFLRLTKRKLLTIAILVLVVIQIYFYTSTGAGRSSGSGSYIDDVLWFNKKKSSNEESPLLSFNSNGSIVAPIYNTLVKSFYDEKKYEIPLSKQRIDSLFGRIQEKEREYKEIFRSLDILMFSDVLEKNEQKYSNVFHRFKHEISHYFETKFDSVVVNENFVNDLKYLSNYYSFEKPRSFVKPAKIRNDQKPVIVTAANSEYYSPMQATVFHIHENYPDCKLIIYDLGLSEEFLKKTKEKCRCEVRTFDADKKYEKISPHVKSLKTYAWKPLIIQEVLREHDLVMYVDSSIRLHESAILPLLDVVPITGLLTQFIGLKLLCYTNPRMFDWFHESTKLFQNLDTIEANIFIMNRNFLNTIIMKAWITCALDETCIAPEGSSVGGCCGCHRYDQDAITIINTYFFGHPTSSPSSATHLPAYSFTKEESYFFKIERYQGMPYF